MKEKILLIDDEPVILNVTSEILLSSGFLVTTASNGEDGFDELMTNDYDLVITDIKMPGLSGMDLIEKIRKEISVDLPVMIITGHGTIDIAIESMKLGAHGFIIKPFTPKELRGAIDDVLKKSRIVKEVIKLKALYPLFEVNKRLLSELEINRLMEIIIREASIYTGAEKASLMLLDNNGALNITASIGLYDKPNEVIVISEEDSISKWVLEKQKPLLLDKNAEQYDEINKMMKRKDSVKSAICLPLIIKGAPLGVLNLSKLESDELFSDSDVEMATVLCGQAAIAIENARLYESVKNSSLTIISTLASAIEARDPYTANHASRIAKVAREIAQEMNVPEIEIVAIEKAGILHDVGKIGIPDHILLKNGPLTPDEFEMMKQHPEIGAKILDNVEGIEYVRDIVRHHHEYFNGKGYPDGLKGADIPLGARIISAADTFEAMTSTRPYRKALRQSEAEKELTLMSGVQFDPEVINAFKKILNKNRTGQTEFNF